jgi:hypothetical protein
MGSLKYRQLEIDGANGEYLIKSIIIVDESIRTVHPYSDMTLQLSLRHRLKISAL